MTVLAPSSAPVLGLRTSTIRHNINIPYKLQLLADVTSRWSQNCEESFLCHAIELSRMVPKWHQSGPKWYQKASVTPLHSQNRPGTCFWLVTETKTASNCNLYGTCVTPARSVRRNSKISTSIRNQQDRSYVMICSAQKLELCARRSGLVYLCRLQVSCAA